MHEVILPGLFSVSVAMDHEAAGEETRDCDEQYDLMSATDLDTAVRSGPLGAKGASWGTGGAHDILADDERSEQQTSDCHETQSAS
jgi:hypothetical protein